MPDVNVLKVNVLPQDDNATDILVADPFTPNTDPIVSGSTVQEALESLQGQIDGGTGGGIDTIGTINSQTKSNNGAVIDGTDLIMQTADATFPGLISTGSQAIAGVKTFNSAPNLNSLTANLPLQLDAGKNVISGAINLASSQVTGVVGLAQSLNGGSTNSLPYQSAANVTNMLAANASATTMFLSQASSGTPAWLQPSMSNLSDNVLVGTFTPTFTFATPGDLSIVYQTQSAYYSKYGKIVTVFIKLNLTPTYTTASGGAIIGNLPYSMKTADVFAICPVTYLGVTGSTSILGVLDTGNSIKLRNFTGVTDVATANCPTAINLFFFLSLTYIID